MEGEAAVVETVGSLVAAAELLVASNAGMMECKARIMLPLLLNDDDRARTAALERSLELASSALQSVGRKKTKALVLRTDTLLDQLAEDEDNDTARH
eukprot:COSAG05_NODE_7192_length_844_cov_1.319463_2_plen_96_part_01